MPFYELGSSNPPVVTLALTKKPTEFDLLTGFRYVDKFDEAEVKVQPRSTDLASVPFFLQWLVRSYGRHTKAALVHDELWKAGGSDIDKLRPANRIFRHAMWELGVPWLRRWLMWAAVTLGMFARSSIGRLRLIVWAGATATAVTALFARSGWTMSRNSARDLSVAGGLLAVASLVVSLAARVGQTKVTDADAKLYWGSMKVGALKVAAAVAAVVTLVLAGRALAQLHAVAGNAVTSSRALFAIGLAMWGRTVGAGAIATIALVILALPLAGIGAALLLYAVLELGSLLALAVGRWIKGVFGGSMGKGPLNPLSKGPLE